MDIRELIHEAKQEAWAFFAHTDPAHDYWHTERVAALAGDIAEKEGADPDICILAAWLHDIGDEKLLEEGEDGEEKITRWLERNEAEEELQQHVMQIVSSISFRHHKERAPETLEGKVVQDADRLDALGAIGIARTFAYTGHIHQPLHDPRPEYRNERNSAIQHFFDKLLRLKGMMNTGTGLEIATKRQRFMVSYLEEFYSEWERKA